MARSSGDTGLASARRQRQAFYLLVACYVALAVAYSFATRLRWGPDEPGHIVYIQSLALDHRFPAMGELDMYRPGAAVSHQVQHPPVYYVLGAVIYRLASPLSEDWRIRVLRFFSALVGAVTLWLLWRLARLVFGAHDDPRPIAATGALTFLPLFGYMGGVVNNDCLVVLLSLAAFYAATTIMAGDDRMRRCALVGVTAGLAIATKEVALALLPVLVAGLLLSRGDAGPSLRRRLAGAALALAIALAIPAPWWIRNQLLLGKPMVYAYVMPAFGGLTDALENPALAREILAILTKQSFLTLWAPYWAIKYVIPRGPYVGAAGAWCMGAGLGLILLSVDHVRGRVPTPRMQVRMQGLMIAFAALVAAGIVRYALFVDYRAIEGGRYMLITWPYLAILGTAGWAHLAGRLRRPVLGWWMALYLVADVVILWAVGRTYGRW